MATIEENIQALIPQMTADIAAKIRERALANIEASAAQAIHDEVKKHIAETILPAVREELISRETEIKAAILAATKGIAELIGATLVKKTAEKLAGYEGDKLIKEVFGPLFRGY